MRKLISIVLTVAMLAGCLAPVLSAAEVSAVQYNSFTVYADTSSTTVDLAAGERTFDVDVMIAKNPGIWCAGVMIVYPDALSLATDYGTVNSSYRDGMFFSDGTESNSAPDLSLEEPDSYKAETIIEENGIDTAGKRYGMIHYECYDLDDYVSADGLLATLTFTLTDKAKAGETYGIELYCESGDDFYKIAYRDEVGFPWYDYYTPDMVGTSISVVDSAAAEQDAFKVCASPEALSVESDCETFGLDVTVENNPGLWAARLFIVYPEALSLDNGFGKPAITNRDEVFPVGTEAYGAADIDLASDGLTPDIERIIKDNGLTREGYRASVMYFQLEDPSAVTLVNGLWAYLYFHLTDKAESGKSYDIDFYYDPAGDFISSAGIANGSVGFEVYNPDCEGATVNVKLPCPHENTTTDSKDATCTENGYTRVYCNDCEREVSNTVLTAPGHDYGEYERESEPTCTKSGFDVRACARCGHKDRREISPAGHSYGDWIVDVEPTVLKKGARHRVCTACGDVEKEDMDRVAIDTQTNENYGLAVFTVVNAQTLSPIRGAQIFVSTETEGEATFVTDGEGKVSIVLPVGKQKVSAYSSGCLSRNLTVNIAPGTNELSPIGLSDLSTYDVELKSEPMTKEEIEDAGIDTSDPANNNVYKYELKLDFGAEIDVPSIIAYFNHDGKYLGGHTFVNNDNDGGGNGDGEEEGDGDDGTGEDDTPSTDEPTKPSDNGIRIPVKDDVITVYPVSECSYLIVRGEVKWLKEMFDVEMLVINNSQTDTLEQLEATIELPDGLSLSEMLGAEQTATQNIADIAAGDSRSVHWYVKGDRAGSYGLTVNLKGMVMPFEEPIDDTFVCEDQIQVWSSDALKLHFEFPNAAYYGDDYPITVTLTNVSDITLYNVSQLLSVQQGMKVYYSDDTDNTKTEIPNFASAGVKELRPGDSIVIVADVNIIFKSEVISKKLEKYIGIVDGIEKFVEGYKAVKAVLDVINTAKKAAGGCLEAIMNFDQSAGGNKEKAELLKKLYENVSSVAQKIDTGDNKVLAASASLMDTGIKKVFDAITTDPETWIREHSVEDIKEIVGKIEGLNTAITEMENGEEGEKQEKEFNIFDSIRTAINTIPVRFVIENVILSVCDSNTESIDWTYSVNEIGPRYFGVSNVSKYIDSLLKVVVTEGYEEVVPWYVLLIPGMDDPYDKDEAIKYIQATEEEIAKFKAKDATGDITFKAWIESGVSAYSASTENENVESDFDIACDNETAKYEDGVLTFTGDATIDVTPKGSEGGILYVEDSEGNLYTYVIDVVEAHSCVAGDRQVILSPGEGTDGFGVKCCQVCSEVMEVVAVSADDVCKIHSFGEAVVRAEATCTQAGVITRECTVCGETDYQFTETLEHQSGEWELTKAPTCTEYGEEVSACTVCQSTMYRSVDTVDHTEGEWRTTKEPSAFVEGEKTLYCAVCDAPLSTEVLPFTKESFGYVEGATEGLLVGLPQGVTPQMLIAHYENMGLDVTVTGADGQPVQIIGTGCKVYFGDAEYIVILGGDVNCDGKLNAFDINIMRRIMIGAYKLDGEIAAATDVNGDGKFNAIDLNILGRYVIGASNE